MAKPRKFQSPDDLEKKINAYFAQQEKAKKPVSKTNLAVYLGTSKQLLCDYEAKPEFKEILQFANLRIEDYLVYRVLTEKFVGGPIFILKSNFGYQDTQTVRHEGELIVKVVKFAEKVSDGNNPPK